MQQALAANANNPQFVQVLNEHHVVLARLYSAQGQHRKALREVAFLHEHPFHPIKASILAAQIQAKAALNASAPGTATRADELKSKVRATLQGSVVRGFEPWDSLEQDPNLRQLFTAEEFAEVRTVAQL